MLGSLRLVYRSGNVNPAAAAADAATEAAEAVAAGCGRKAACIVSNE